MFPSQPTSTRTVSLFSLLVLVVGFSTATNTTEDHRGGWPTPKFPFDPRTSKYCDRWHNNVYDISAPHYCRLIAQPSHTTVDALVRWNPSIGYDCLLTANTSYCVGALLEPPVAPVYVSDVGVCGKNQQICLGSKFGDCCGKDNTCGSSLDHCAVSKGCQRTFGICQAVSVDDGICGFNGRTCIGSRFGECCGKDFYCGSSLDHCSVSKGCLGAFGTCQAVSEDGICGFNGRTCVGSKFGQCCGKNFYCGSSLDSCSVSKGCLGAFGTCQAVSEDGICGFNGRTCVGSKFGECCGKDYYCGSTTKSCLAENCLESFGKCNAK